MDWAVSKIRRTRVEDYLIAIEQICGQGHDLAGTGSIALELGISNGTCSSMLKELAAQGLIDHSPYKGVKTTDRGRVRGQYILRRTRLIELFLLSVLNVNRKMAENEAWCLEPAASDQLIERIDAFLNQPMIDSLGQPIPRVDGKIL